MTITISATTTHTSPLFAAIFDAVMRAFDALHDVQWRAPWNSAAA